MTLTRDQRSAAKVTHQRDPETGVYAVFLGDEFIGRVAKEIPLWKAVDGYMVWRSYYKTRQAAFNGLVKRWRKGIAA